MEHLKQSEISTLLHLVKSCIGSGILTMPLAFKYAGLLMGTLGMILAATICTHCSYMLVISCDNLRKRTNLDLTTFADVAEESFRCGPEWSQKYHNFIRKVVNAGIFVGYYSCLSIYTVILSMNLEKIISSKWIVIDIRLYMIMLLVPFLCICYLPNWKYLTPVSMITNLLMVIGLLITIYYLIKDIHSISERSLVASFSTIPTFFGIIIFSLQTIGVVLPLKNNMKHPNKFLGLFGVLNKGNFIIAFSYILIGFLGYLCYGEETSENIILNLPNNNSMAQTVQILISLSIFGAFGVQFFVSLEIIWSGMNNRYKEKTLLIQYTIRTLLVIAAVAIAVAIPSVIPFVSLMGAFCFSIAGIMIPTIIKILTFWEDGFGKFYGILIKDICIMIFGTFALIFGTKNAIEDIIKLYS